MRSFVSAKEMQWIDQETMRLKGISSWELMQEVAQEMTFTLARFVSKESRVLVLCGLGNNGGDGYCVAEFLRQAGYLVKVFAVNEAKSQDCQKAAANYKGQWYQQGDSFDVLVDAVFGGSGRSQLETRIAHLFQSLGSAARLNVALDVPSGVDANSGSVDVEAFRADLTLCVAYPRESFLKEEVARCLGQVCFVGGNFAAPRRTKFLMLEPKDFHFRKRDPVAPKSAYGKCAVLGGSASTPGAAFLTAEAAHRSGAGYVSLFFAQREGLTVDLRGANFLYPKDWSWADIEGFDSLVLGPGGLPSDWQQLDAFSQPQVFDADALRAWPQFPLTPKKERLLTPHPGEAAALLGCSVSEIQTDRLTSLETLLSDTEQSVYLKGAPGLLGFRGDDQYYVNLSINPVFAKAGSGDVLSGLLGGFLAQAPGEFEKAVFSALVFQKEVGEILRQQRASIASDQLAVFSKAFESLKGS